jgi:hypothetical protein
MSEKYTKASNKPVLTINAPIPFRPGCRRFKTAGKQAAMPRVMEIQSGIRRTPCPFQSLKFPKATPKTRRPTPKKSRNP